MAATTAQTKPGPNVLYVPIVLALIGGIAGVSVAVATGWWQLAVGATAPDLALLAGIGRGLGQGQLHPRAVPLYNAAHVFAGPVALGALLAAGVLPAASALLALGWALHIAIDRSFGYTLRARDGYFRR